MKITALKTYLVEPRWLFLKVETDAGISGWGEPVLEGHAETLAAKIGELEDFLIGRNPLMIEDIWQSIYRNGCYRGGPVLMSAIAGIDMALWDIKGRYHDAPVHALLGGKVRDFIRSYCWIGGDRPQNLEVEAAALMARGFDCTKLNATRELRMIDCYREVDRIVAQMGALRDFVGDRMDIALDFHGRVHVPMAKVLLKELEPLRPIFVEDVVASSQIDAMADLAKFTSIPLAVGERLHSRYDFKRVFETRAASLINPDTAHAGGISEMVRIGHMAEAYDVAIAPHCPLGPIALAASLQVDAVCQNAVLQEQSLGMHYNGPVDMQDYLVEGTGFDLREGCLYIPEGPGLGIEINEEFVVKQALKGHKWRAPEWRHADGSVAEW
ncbi:galactonate dehydratase [Falsihalocynthiibacter sp. S25ZX9]|uniref:galactonate dehydratase n=1 Tax=unclassified Falsihalocynthiibacter TaxID=2854191 RepID=UPI00351076C7